MSTQRKVPIALRPAHADADLIRLRLDRRTIVLVRNMERVAYWKQRYPNAEIVEGAGSERKE